MKKLSKQQSQDIHLTVTVEEFRDLIKAVLIAQTVIGLDDVEERMDENLEAMQQNLLAIAHQRGLTEMIEYDDLTEELIVTEDIEEEVFNILDRYEEEMFWESLTLRLAERDYLSDHQNDLKEEKELSFLLEESSPYVEKYFHEFERHGVERLYIKPSIYPIELNQQPS